MVDRWARPVDVTLIEASLSFLGLGDPNRASWGRMTSDAQQYLLVAWWLAVFPGVAIVIAAVGINLVVDAQNSPRSWSTLLTT